MAMDLKKYIINGICRKNGSPTSPSSCLIFCIMPGSKCKKVCIFTNSETALLVDILSCHMPEKDRKKLPFLKLAAGRSQAGSINRLLASFRCMFLYF